MQLPGWACRVQHSCQGGRGRVHGGAWRICRSVSAQSHPLSPSTQSLPPSPGTQSLPHQIARDPPSLPQQSDVTSWSARTSGALHTPPNSPPPPSSLPPHALPSMHSPPPDLQGDEAVCHPHAAAQVGQPATVQGSWLVPRWDAEGPQAAMVRD